MENDKGWYNGIQHYQIRDTGAGNWFYYARPPEASEADKIGLISRLVDEDKLMETAMGIASIMLEKTPLRLRFTKEALNQNQTAPSLEAAIELENRNQSILCITPELFKAVEEFSRRKKESEFKILPNAVPVAPTGWCLRCKTTCPESRAG